MLLFTSPAAPEGRVPRSRIQLMSFCFREFLCHYHIRRYININVILGNNKDVDVTSTVKGFQRWPYFHRWQVNVSTDCITEGFEIKTQIFCDRSIYNPGNLTRCNNLSSFYYVSSFIADKLLCNVSGKL